MDAQEGMTPVEQMLAEKAEEVTDLVLRYQGMGVGGPQSAIVEVLGGIWSAADLNGWDRGFGLSRSGLPAGIYVVCSACQRMSVAGTVTWAHDGPVGECCG